ncbi:hypothetical protein AVEN_162390-1, partial [Araneus ventricosus]
HHWLHEPESPPVHSVGKKNLRWGPREVKQQDKVMNLSEIGEGECDARECQIAHRDSWPTRDQVSAAFPWPRASSAFPMLLNRWEGDINCMAQSNCPN